MLRQFKSLGKKTLIALTGNAVAQSVLDRLVNTGQWLMGVGSGSSPSSSGEQILLDILRKKAAKSNRDLCIVDVGANKGQFLSMVLEGLQTVGHHIHAFEPGSAAFQQLSMACANNPHITLVNVALGREPGIQRLFYVEPGASHASLYKRNLNHLNLSLSQSEEIRVETLDDYCRRHAVSKIDHLKLDVEGHELEVLRGGSMLFKAGAIDMISFEFGGCNVDSRTFLKDFTDFFREYGAFDIFRITPSGFLVPIKTYRERDEQFRTTNYLVLHHAEQHAAINENHL